MKRMNKEQVEVLVSDLTEYGSKPSEARKKRLSDMLGVSQQKIGNWFQNRRAQEKKKREHDEYLETLKEFQRVTEITEGLKSRYHELQLLKAQKGGANMPVDQTLSGGFNYSNGCSNAMPNATDPAEINYPINGVSQPNHEVFPVADLQD